MNITKSRLKQLIREELTEIESRLPRARDFGSTSPEMHGQFDTQRGRIEDYMADARALRDKMNQYVEEFQNVGPRGESDLGGLTPEWRNLLDALNAVKQ